MTPPNARLAALVLLCLVPALALGEAAAPVREAAGSAPSAAAAPSAPQRQALRMSPMAAEMFGAIDEQRDRVRALRTELSRTRDGARSLELQRAIAMLRHETELRLLRIQAAYARREGRLETAAGLEAAIAALTAPPESREPMPRPAPARDVAR